MQRDTDQHTQAELTAHNQSECEAENMLGATLTRGHYAVSSDKTQVYQHIDHSNLSVKEQRSPNWC